MTGPERPHRDLIDSALSPDGWAYASAPPVDSTDPGRFHALFGRDSLIFALQVLPERPDVARATLRALAGLIGRRTDPENDEEPGRIVHEYRPVALQWLVDAGWPVRDGELRYYGTSDANAWFLVLLDATGEAELVRELAPVTRAVSDWLARSLDRGHGLVRCGPRRYPGGLAQQGWRDAQDPAHDRYGGGIVDLRGHTPVAPLADVDSQAVAVAALDALVRLDPTRADVWRVRATALRERLAALFGPDVMAFDADDRPVAGAGSQLGWLLWADALPADLARTAAQRLTRPDVLTGYGVRTLSAEHPAFMVEGYHRGAVWPFDNWLAWGGLRGVGLVEQAEQVRSGVRRALQQLGRHPELYAVTPADRLSRIPIANHEQAWTLGAMVAFDLDWTGRASPGPQTATSRP